jgi:hypothetical protein
LLGRKTGNQQHAVQQTMKWRVGSFLSRIPPVVNEYVYAIERLYGVPPQNRDV